MCLPSVTARPQEYYDTGLDAYTLYEYQVEAYNAYGSTKSSITSFFTSESEPSGDITLQVIVIYATTAMLAWTPPTNKNGVITKYEITSTTLKRPTPPFVHWSGLEYKVDLDNLTPYTFYTFFVSACTSVGCLKSSGVEKETKSASPEDQASPILTALSSTELKVDWNPPNQPNGKYLQY